MNIEYFEGSISATYPSQIKLPYRHLYIENTSGLPASTITVKQGNRTLLKLNPSEYFNLLDVNTLENIEAQSIQSIKQAGSFLELVNDSGGVTTFKIINYGL